ncbi:fibronectin type III domain-containing protein [Winogradskyella sp. PC D3.3]
MIFRMRHLFFCIVLALFSFACEEILVVEDISQDTVAILAPTTDSVLAEGIISFSWSELEEAEQYRLQLATPTFENASQVLLDSLITTTSFSKTLEFGNYEWRIRAENSEYQTAYTIQNFTVEE